MYVMFQCTYLLCNILLCVPVHVYIITLCQCMGRPVTQRELNLPINQQNTLLLYVKIVYLSMYMKYFSKKILFYIKFFLDNHVILF